MKNILILSALLLAASPIHATTFHPEPEPKISMEKALDLAKAYVRAKKIDLSHHYLDRIWIGYQEGQPDRRWIISWSPKQEDVAETQGWIILTVKLDGTVAHDKGAAVPWIDPRMLERNKIKPPPAIKPSPGTVPSPAK